MGDFPPVAQQNPAVSKRMARIVGRAMSLDPSHRFSSLREMGRELLYLAGQRTRITWSLSFGEVSPKRAGTASALSVLPASSSSLPAARGYGKWSSLGAISLGVVLFGAAGALLWARDSEAPPAVVLHSLKGDSANAPVANVPAAVQNAPAPAAQPSPRIAANPTPPEAPKSSDPAPSPPPGVIVKAPAAPAPAPVQPKQEASSSGRSTSEKMRQTLNDDDGKRHSPRPTPRRRPVPVAPAPKPVEAAAEAPKPPEWVPKAPPPARQEPHRNTALGTNNAPIFE
jgi:hypothetical protein